MSEEDYSYSPDESGDEKHRIESIRENLSGRDFGQDHRKLAAAGLISIFLVAAVFYGLKDSGDRGETAKVFEGETVNVSIGNRYVEPNRPTLKPEYRLRFTNNADFSYAMSFESGVETFVLEPGESRIVDIDYITHYNATPLREGRRTIKAGVYVDR